MPDGTRYSRTLATRMDAEAWLVSERGLIDRDVWTPPQMCRAAEEKRQREAAHNTVAGFAERYLAERSLRPTTIRGYRKLLANRIPAVLRGYAADRRVAGGDQEVARFSRPDERSGLPAAPLTAPSRRGGALGAAWPAVSLGRRARNHVRSAGYFFLATSFAAAPPTTTTTVPAAAAF